MYKIFAALNSGGPAPGAREKNYLYNYIKTTFKTTDAMKFHHIIVISAVVAGASGAMYFYIIFHKYKILQIQEKLRREEERFRKYNKLIMTLTISTVCLVLSIPIAFRIKKLASDFFLRLRDIWC